MNIAIIGAGGRMGLAIVRLAIAAGDSIVGAADIATSTHGKDIGELAGIENLGVAVGPDAASAVLGADVCIDFSSPKATPEVARAVMKEKIGWVCGTTGIDDAAIRAHAGSGRRYWRFFLPHGLWDRARQRQGNARDQRPALRA